MGPDPYTGKVPDIFPTRTRASTVSVRSQPTETLVLVFQPGSWDRPILISPPQRTTNHLDLQFSLSVYTGVLVRDTDSPDRERRSVITILLVRYYIGVVVSTLTGSEYLPPRPDPCVGGPTWSRLVLTGPVVTQDPFRRDTGVEGPLRGLGPRGRGLQGRLLVQGGLDKETDLCGGGGW